MGEDGGVNAWTCVRVMYVLLCTCVRVYVVYVGANWGGRQYCCVVCGGGFWHREAFACNVFFFFFIGKSFVKPSFFLYLFFTFLV